MSEAPGLDLTLGMILIGLPITASLFGVTSSQTLWYFRHYPSDRKFLRIMAFTVWSLDAMSLFLYSAAMWDYLVRKKITFGNLALPWTSNAQIVVNAVAIGIIQTFYTYRIWTLTRYKSLIAVVVTFVVADLSLGILIFLKSVTTTSLSDYLLLTPYDIALSTTTATTDVLLCGALVTLLARSRTGSAGANRLINRLMFYTINTGLLTSVCSIASFVTVLVIPQTNAYVMCYYIGSRMYTVSLLATLNAREGLRLQAEFFGQGTLPRLTSRTSNSVSSKRSIRAVVDAMAPSQEIVVAIQHDTTVTFDEASLADIKHDPHHRAYRYRPESSATSRSRMTWLLGNVLPKPSTFKGSGESDSKLTLSV